LDKTSSGPGTTVIEVLARQFDACVEVLRNFLGTTVSITHAAFNTTSLKG
jgi:two-component sensor histidine kinase